MANDSSTGGYLLPEDPLLPAEDAPLDAIFQQMVVGLTGIAGSLVRPRWQPNPPKQPAVDVDWCSLGVMAQVADDGPAIMHDTSGEGSDDYVRHEDIDLLLTFYGPNGQRNAAQARDGLYIGQNLEALKTHQIVFVDTGPIRTVPELVNQQWVRRFDLPIRFRRKIARTYPVLNILSADVHLFDDSGNVDEVIPVPPPAL